MLFFFSRNSFSRDGAAESCNAGVEYCESSRMAQKTDAGRSQLGMRWTGRTWSRWVRRKLDGTGAMWLMSWNAMGSAWASLTCDQHHGFHVNTVPPWSLARYGTEAGISVVDEHTCQGDRRLHGN